MEILDTLFGLTSEKLSGYQMVARAGMMFVTSLILIRIGGIRTLGKQSAFDTLTLLMLSSIIGRAIVAADQPFFGTMLAAFILMLLHRSTAWITFRNKKAGKLIKGTSLLLLKNGQRQEKNLSRSLITEEDILEALRRDINITSLDKIKEVYLERSGEISIIKE